MKLRREDAHHSNESYDPKDLIALWLWERDVMEPFYHDNEYHPNRQIIEILKKKLPYGSERIYNKEYLNRGISDIVLWDVIPVAEGEVLKFIFESINSECRQGLWIWTDNGIEILNDHCPSVEIWYDTAPKEDVFICHTAEGFLSVYNVFEDKQNVIRSLGTASGMQVDELPNGRRYHCNDTSFNDPFDRLIFRIERVPQ